MISDRQNADDLESLSALFDGELDGDAERFARRRLGHDAAWQQACGRWQLIGDALRGQATTAAPADFAPRVAAAVATEPVPVLVVPAPGGRAQAPSRRLHPGWFGGALAASLALVAVFAVRSPGPQGGAAPTVAVDPEQVPAAVAQPAPPVAPASPPVSGSRGIAAAEPTPAPTRAAPAPAANGIAVAEPARAPARAVRTPAAERAARESTARIARAVQRQAAGFAEPEEVAPAIVADAAPDPFRPRTEIVTRPWPRAILPNSQAAGALTASFEAPATGASRPFYPFEPQPPADPPASRQPAP
jgi:negative regulator of sigma E activity